MPLAPCAGAEGGGGHESEEGGTYWLPGGVAASFRMVGAPGEPSPQQQQRGDSAGEGEGRADPRGLCMSLLWLTDVGTALAVERVYAPDGGLVEVRHSSAVKGGRG